MIARVTLEIAIGKEFDYSIPEEWVQSIEVGTRVKVPFGARQVLGCVTAVLAQSPHGSLKPLAGIIGKQSLVTPKVLRLARWIGEYYCCPAEIALKSVLPEAVRKEDAKWREHLFVHSVPTPPGIKLTPRQAAVVKELERVGSLLLRDLVERAGTSVATVRRLEELGVLRLDRQVVERDPYGKEEILSNEPLRLTDEQARALKPVCEAIDRCEEERHTTFLLHGVTGSGKTEVYLQAIAHCLQQGRGAIVLVPEISLTPQTVERFKARFSTGPNRTLIAVLHSHLSSGERHDEWHKIRQGRARIVIGARSAVFSPVEPLGLIIVDEEHESSYKQEEAPRYHARDVAVVRGQFENAVVLLGSATPSMESFFNVHRKKYSFLAMPSRVDDTRLPIVRVLDMREAARSGKGTPVFSPELKEALTQRLERKEQSMLFLNRRGYATSFQCPLCGYVAKCVNCSVSLTYHRSAEKLSCHICGHQQLAPKICPEPKCRNPAVRYAGVGTEKVEATLAKLFPHARVRRMDSDVMKRKDDYRRVLGDFRVGKIDILVGTQMIAKGLHFPNVTLVGIVYADLSLHVPDFRAGERTFQLLTQVAGRAGRGDVEGEVFVQAFTPFHPAIQYARRHDFAGFYEQEIEFRQQLNYPPLSRLALLTLKGRNEQKVEFAAAHLGRRVQELIKGMKDTTMAGPAPAPLARAESLYRFQLMLRTRRMSELSRRLAPLSNSLDVEDVSLTVDIDPVNLS